MIRSRSHHKKAKAARKAKKAASVKKKKTAAERIKSLPATVTATGAIRLDPKEYWRAVRLAKKAS